MPNVESVFINFIRISLVKVTGKKGFLSILCAKKYRSSAERFEIQNFCELNLLTTGMAHFWTTCYFNVMRNRFSTYFSKVRKKSEIENKITSEKLILEKICYFIRFPDFLTVGIVVMFKTVILSA